MAIMALPLAVHAELIPANRLVDWTPGVSVGVPGGIPTNRTRLIDVTQAPFHADNSGATNAQVAIQAAIKAATPGDVVYLPAGTYRIDSTLSIDQSRDGITVRGAGMGATVLDCRMKSAALYIGSGSDYLWNSPSSNNKVISGQTKGSTVLTVADTSPYTVGNLVNLAIQNQSDDDAIRAGAVPTVSIAGYPNLRRQLGRVVSKTPTTLTVTPGLYDNYAGLEISVFTVTFQTDHAGVEDLTINCANGQTQVGVVFEQAYGCWLKGVRVTKAENYAFSIGSSANIEIRQSYADQRATNGTNGAGVLMGMASGCLIEDNILHKFFPLIEVNGGASGNVVAYNFCYDSSVFGLSGMGIDTNHAPHNSFNLYEGNVLSTLQADGYFGGASEDTVFRNWLHGTNPGGLTGAHAVVLNRMTRNYNLVGNLMGKTGDAEGAVSFGNPNMGNGGYSGSAQPSKGIFWKDWKMTANLTNRTSDNSGTLTLLSGSLTTSQYVSMTWGANSRLQFYPATVSGNVVTLVGGAGNPLPPAGTVVEVFSGSGGYQELDLDVAATTLLKGNWYAKTNSVPAAESLGADPLPPSLYRSTKPAWFGDLTWPAFNPTSPNQSFEAIPAGYRYFHGTQPTSDVVVPPQPSEAPSNVKIMIQVR